MRAVREKECNNLSSKKGDERSAKAKKSNILLYIDRDASLYIRVGTPIISLYARVGNFVYIRHSPVPKLHKSLFSFVFLARSGVLPFFSPPLLIAILPFSTDIEALAIGSGRHRTLLLLLNCATSLRTRNIQPRREHLETSHNIYLREFTRLVCVSIL